jgi:hypothetical protein
LQPGREHVDALLERADSILQGSDFGSVAGFALAGLLDLVGGSFSERADLSPQLGQVIIHLPQPLQLAQKPSESAEHLDPPAE